MDTKYLLQKTQNQEILSFDDLVFLLKLPEHSKESYMVMAEANRISKELTWGQAEVHAQFALNLAPCPQNCKFCSFAQVNGIFNNEEALTIDQAITYIKQFEKDGANAVFLMTTAVYPFEKFIEFIQEIKKNINSNTTLIGNVGDQSYENAKKMKDCGIKGVYHALRLREGKDTGIPAENRKKSIKNFQEAGLQIGTCVEPVGPEHTNEEIADMINFTASFNPAYSGAGRRISIPGTGMAKLGMISELKMAQIVAITRLGMPRSVKGNCTHEPCTLGAAAGASLFWAEKGANPRDIEKNTEKGRGETVESCRKKFAECGWESWNGSSRFYQRKNQ